MFFLSSFLLTNVSKSYILSLFRRDISPNSGKPVLVYSAFFSPKDSTKAQGETDGVPWWRVRDAVARDLRLRLHEMG